MHLRSAFAAVLLAACTGDDDAATPPPETSTTTEVPGDAAGMNAWLHTKAYASWPKESAAHPSTGPHASSVLTFVNPTLEASLEAGAAEHPEGSAAVKEFLRDGEVTGWAAYVKTKPASEGGGGWYWYETFDVTPGRHSIEGQGKPLCAGCHAGGKDFVLTPFPLR
ncbi:MAG: hypothetical protein KIT84_32760 [Labilithrix sp.]|nr:hypothetical protein [Labilithrix sp.]MCW5815847.1 hypothetical protein [Labilithrix sp.]